MTKLRFYNEFENCTSKFTATSPGSNELNNVRDKPEGGQPVGVLFTVWVIPYLYGRVLNNNKKTQNVNSVNKEVMKLNKLYLTMTNADVLTRDKIVELENRIQEDNPHVIMISEVKPKNFKRTLTPIEYKIEGYEMVHKNIEENRGRGMCTYVNSKLEYKEVKLKTNFNEYIAIDVKLNENECMLLVNIYRSGSSGDENSKELNNMLKEISNLKYQHTVIGGDVNYKDIDWQNNMCVTSATSGDFLFLEAVRDAYLTPHIEVPTRGRGTDKPTTLDLLITNDDALVEDLIVGAPVGKSDHAVISVNIVCDLEMKPISKKRFMYDKANYDDMRKVLDINWEENLKSCGDDVNKMWAMFKSKMKEAEELITSKVVTINGKNKKYKTPLDRKSLAKIKRKNRLWDRYCKTSSGQAYLEYCRTRNQV